MRARGLPLSFRVTMASLLFLLPAVTVASDWQTSLQTAMSAHQAGDLLAAAPHYRAAMAEHEPLQRHPAILTNFGLTAQAEGATEEAIAAFHTVSELTPDDANAWFNLGNALADRAAGHEEAADAMRKCLSLSPTDADAYYSLGLALLSSKSPDPTTAVAALQVSIALAPTDAKALVSLGDGLAKLQRWPESARSFEEALSMRPTHAGTWASLGYVQEELGDLSAAEMSWRESIRLAPDASASSQSNLGGMLRRADRLAEGRAAYAAALTIEPTSVRHRPRACARLPAAEPS